MSWFRNIGNFFTDTIPNTAAKVGNAINDNVLKPVFDLDNNKGFLAPMLNQIQKDSGIDTTKSDLGIGDFMTKGIWKVGADIGDKVSQGVNVAEQGLGVLDKLPGGSAITAPLKETLEITKGLASGASAVGNFIGGASR